MAGARRRTGLHALVVVALCLAGYGLAQREIEDQRPVADEAQYVVMAHNIFHRGVISLTPPDQEPAVPSAYREPGYPVLLAGLMVLDPGLAASAVRCLAADAGDCARVYAGARQVNALLMIAAGVLVWIAVWRLVRRPGVAHLALFLLIANLELHEFNTFLISDQLALFVAALLSLLLLLGYQSGRPIAAAGVGAVLGVLVLTKGAFVVLALAVGALLLARLWGDAAARRRHGLALALFVIAHGIVVGAWIARNEIALGHPVLTQRGGHVLAHRVELNTMTATEYGVAFVWWTRGFGDNLARRWLPEAAYRRFELDRPQGFYKAAQANWEAAIASERAAGAGAWAAERRVTNRMVDELLGRLPKNVVTTLPIAYRGLFIDEFIVLTLPALIVVLIGARRRLRAYYWFALPGLYVIGFHSFLTLNLPRFNIPALPALAAAGAIALWWALERWRARPIPPA